MLTPGRGRRWLLPVLLLLPLAIACAGTKLYAPEVARMEAQSVKSKIGTVDFTLIDGRYDRDWERSKRMIAGAVREDPLEVSLWAPKYPKTDVIVVYCA